MSHATALIPAPRRAAGPRPNLILHLLASRFSQVRSGRRVTVDRCACGVTSIANSEILARIPEPHRIHLVDVVGHVAEYCWIGPETLPESGQDAVRIGCVCGWIAEMCDTVEIAHALHDTHALYPHILTAD